MDIQNQLFIIWIPLLIIVVFALVGALRGTFREAIVAAALMLGTVINLRWGDQWGEGLAGSPFNLERNTAQFWTQSIVLWLVVLVVGFGLGSYAPRDRISSGRRLGGALLGLATGAALAGESLRYGFQYLDNAQASSAIVTNTFSQALMIWAAWYPIVLALAGAVLVLVVPLTKVQRAVSEPSPASNWTPTTVAAPAAAAVVGTAAAVTQPYSPPPMPAPTSYYGAPLAAAAPATGITDASRDAGFTPSAAQTTVMPEVEDAPPTSLLPTDEAPTRTAGPSGDAGGSGAETRSFATTPADGSAAGTQGDASAFGGSASTAPSWLLEPVNPRTEEIRSTDSGYAYSPPVSGGSNATAEERTSASSTDDKPGESRPAETTRCANCGATLLPGAAFCTECGTPVT